ncbi:VanZ family protein [Rummeliibacillus pycnus]|uniref:VanZ family protein n=1 Tax=Rummeliibacillus pycnus TaxID=101070 RepID=UPI000C9AD196|nr:VanZ family protein [Rummeliibacillus pycnus]
MDAYIQPINLFITVFTILAFVIWIPWLIYTYRKYGFLPLSKMLISFSFIFYFFSALFLVILPLPTIRDTCSMQEPGTQHYSLVPFRFISDIFKNSGMVWTQPGTFIHLFEQTAFYQAFFNFLMLMPFGVYLRYFLKQKKQWKIALGITFVLTLFFEMIQVTGILGYYNCAYRIFDVDDLLLNTLGGIVGFFIAPAVLALFPSKEKIHEKADFLLKLDEVRSLSVLIAVALDLFFTDIATQIFLHYTSVNDVNEFLVRSISLFVFFFVIPIFWNGRTIGTFIMRFRYDSKVSRRTTINRLFKRFAAIYVTFFITFVINVLTTSQISMDSPYYHVSYFLQIGTMILYGIVTIVLFIHIMLVVFGKGKRRFYFDEASDLYTTKK